MRDWGTAILTRHDDGRVTVDQADATIAIAGELLAGLALDADPAAVHVTDDGHLALGSDAGVEYRPVRFAQEAPGVIVLLCERVTAGG